MEISWRGSGLWELLRYVIPGLTTILYTFALLYAFIGMYGFHFGYFIKNNLSTIAVLISLLALPIGYLVYTICLAFEYEKFLGRRGGRDVVEKIYSEMDNKDSHTVAEINEIMDIIFFKYEEKLGGDISRVVMVHMSTLTVIKYAPICAFFLSILLLCCFNLCHPFIFIFHIIFHITFLVLLLSFIIFVYSIVKERIIGDSGFLKKTLDELERNTLLLGECEIRHLIRKKVEFKKIRDEQLKNKE